jgi:hypothetical protein
VRAGSRCEYCLLPTEGQVGRFPIDHVIPRVDGGVTELSNLALACSRCNAAKWKHTQGIDPMTGETVPLFNPRVTSWAQHFRWSEGDPCLIEGITACGRAAVNRLQLNHPELVLIRRLLIELGIMTTALP